MGDAERASERLCGDSAEQMPERLRRAWNRASRGSSELELGSQRTGLQRQVTRQWRAWKEINGDAERKQKVRRASAAGLGTSMLAKLEQEKQARIGSTADGDGNSDGDPTPHLPPRPTAPGGPAKAPNVLWWSFHSRDFLNMSPSQFRDTRADATTMLRTPTTRMVNGNIHIRYPFVRHLRRHQRRQRWQCASHFIIPPKPCAASSSAESDPSPSLSICFRCSLDICASIKSLF